MEVYRNTKSASGMKFFFPLIDSADRPNVKTGVTTIDRVVKLTYRPGATSSLTTVDVTVDTVWYSNGSSAGYYGFSYIMSAAIISAWTDLTTPLTFSIEPVTPGDFDTQIIVVYDESNNNIGKINYDQLDGNNATLNLKKISVVNDDSNPAMDIRNTIGLAAKWQGATKAIQIIGETEEGIDINSAGNGIDINSTGGDGFKSVGSIRGIYTVGGAAEGISALGATDGLLLSGGSKDINAGEIDQINAGVNITSVNSVGVTNVDDFKADVSALALEASVQQIVSKLPAGTISDLALTDQVDGVTLFNIYELVMAMVNGRYEIDNPSAGKITFFKRDNTTILTTVNVTAVNRTRDV